MVISRSICRLRHFAMPITHPLLPHRRGGKDAGLSPVKYFYLCVVILTITWMMVAAYMLYQNQRNLSSMTSFAAHVANGAPKVSIDVLEPSPQASAWKTLDGSPTVLFAHRGEKILVPEHTEAAYEIASILGADFVEPDLVLTKDDVLVCHHDLYLKDGTNVQNFPEFENLSSILPDGSKNWYICNFTYAQLKQLSVKQQNVGIRPLEFDYKFGIPTFDEYLEVVHRMTYKLPRAIGVVPELKNPAFHNQGQEPNHMEKIFLQAMASHGYPLNSDGTGDCKATVEGRQYPIDCPTVIVQCFEKPPLEYLKSQTDLDLLMLIEDDALLLTYDGIKEIAQVAKYYATWKEHLYVGPELELKYMNVSWNETAVEERGGFVPADQFVTEAHNNGMKVVLYTIKDSREGSTRGCAMPTGCEPANKTAELNYFFGMGVDGIFVENVAESREIRAGFSDSLLRNSAQKAFRSNGLKDLAMAVGCAVANYFCQEEE